MIWVVCFKLTTNITKIFDGLNWFLYIISIFRLNIKLFNVTLLILNTKHFFAFMCSFTFLMQFNRTFNIVDIISFHNNCSLILELYTVIGRFERRKPGLCACRTFALSLFLLKKCADVLSKLVVNKALYYGWAMYEPRTECLKYSLRSMYITN